MDTVFILAGFAFILYAIYRFATKKTRRQKRAVGVAVTAPQGHRGSAGLSGGAVFVAVNFIGALGVVGMVLSAEHIPYPWHVFMGIGSPLLAGWMGLLVHDTMDARSVDVGKFLAMILCAMCIVFWIIFPMLFTSELIDFYRGIIHG